MSDPIVRFKLPPVLRRSDGGVRRVGFELEFSGLTLDQTVGALRDALGGRARERSVAERALHVDALGEFNIELDWDFLKRKAAEEAKAEDSGDWVDALSQVAAALVPMEVVCPPIAVTDLESLQPMICELRQAGAVGTEESLVAAYGVHINTEIPNLDAATLSAYLRAFALLQWWLVAAHEVNITRKVSPFIDLYSQDYLRQILSGATPSMDDILTGYLTHNASRNRALDMLPMLAEIDEDRIRRVVNDPKIKPRPAFHYRLPDCHIEEAAWSLATAWNRWWVVEALAQRPDDIEGLTEAFFAADRPVLGVSRSGWVEFIDRWLKDRAWV